MKARDVMENMNRKRPEGLKSDDQSYRVLVVDDSTTMRKIIGQHLKAEAYEICGEASNGAEALEFYKELSPDVVTLDINMPLMGGLEALKRILDYDSRARVLMVTSEGDRETVIEAVTAGAQGYIVKPPNKARVCEKVKYALQNQ